MDTTNMEVCVNLETKERAMVVLNELGVSASELFDMLLNQVATQKRIPFSITKPDSEDEYHSFDSWKDAKEWLNA
jgi:addiction module RelB/DinJ family antitoxin